MTTLEYEQTLPVLREKILNAMRWGLKKRYNAEIFLYPESLDFIANDFGNNLTIDFKGVVYGNKVETENLHYVPDGRWAHLRTALFPKWVLRKFPVKNKTIAQKITVYNSYPSLYPTKDSCRYYEKIY